MVTCRHFRALALVSLLAPLLAACLTHEDTDGHAQRHFSWRRVRVLVADATTGELSLFDAEDEAITHQFSPDAVGGITRSLRPSFTGYHALLELPSGLRLVASGVSIWEHIDHVHVYKAAPQVIGNLLGPHPPTYIQTNATHILAEYRTEDSTRSYLLINEANPVDITSPIITGVPVLMQSGLAEFTGRPATGHFTAWPSMGTNAVVRSVPTASCDEVVLASGAGDRVALACANGFLLFDSLDKPPLFTNHAHAMATREILLHPHVAGALFRLNDGALVNLSANGAYSSWMPPPGICDLKFDPGTGETLVVLTAAGTLFVLDRAGAVRASIEAVVPAFDCRATLRPRLGLAPERAYLTEPSGGALVDVDLLSRRVAARYSVGGQPSALAVLGLDPRNASWRGPRPGEP